VAMGFGRFPRRQVKREGATDEVTQPQKKRRVGP
jgi:hypothetical protein